MRFAPGTLAPIFKERKMGGGASHFPSPNFLLLDFGGGREGVLSPRVSDLIHRVSDLIHEMRTLIHTALYNEHIKHTSNFLCSHLEA